jgi:hypothetical protein
MDAFVVPKMDTASDSPGDVFLIEGARERDGRPDLCRIRNQWQDSEEPSWDSGTVERRPHVRGTIEIDLRQTPPTEGQMAIVRRLPRA